MYTVVGSPFTRTMRVLWMLEELGQSYELTPAKPHSPEVLAVNPSGKVPVLVVDGVGITDSLAIITYLADKHGALTYPAGTLDRARQDGFSQFAADVLEGPLWTAARHGFILAEEERVAAVRPVCKAEFQRGLVVLEKILGDGPYLMGETFTIPDLLVGHLANWAENGSKWELPATGKVAEYLARVRSRPALAAALARGKAATAA
ncbi:MAG: glutathione S-transferase [Paracoccaceae bacterium]|jgi:glutathione S-transferase